MAPASFQIAQLGGLGQTITIMLDTEIQQLQVYQPI